MSEIHLTIDGVEVVGQSGQTILELAKAAGVDIPTLCHHPMVSDLGGCRLCLVEVEKMRGFQTACTCPATDGMVVHTETPKLFETRSLVLQLLFTSATTTACIAPPAGIANCKTWPIGTISTTGSLSGPPRTRMSMPLASTL